jgi:hypothetical protein
MIKEDLYTSDGRISPDKAIAIVRNLMESMSHEEFIKLATQKVVLKGNSSLKERVQEIRNRLEAATPGPWVLSGKYTIKEARKLRPDYPEVYDNIKIVVFRANQAYRSEEEDKANAEFVAHAPEDIRWLLERLGGPESPL